MKKLLSLLTLTMAGLIAVPAITRAEDQKPDAPKRGDGPRHGGMGSPEERLKMMTEKLGLTQDQQDKIKAIYAKNEPAFKELRSKGRDNLTEDDKNKMKELMKSQMEEVSAVLTPEQREKMKAQMHEMREKHGGAGDKGGRGERKKPDGDAPAK